MNTERLARLNTAIVRLLPLLDAKHPDSRGTILIHGAPSATEGYVEIARGLDFKFECTQTNVEFLNKIKSHPHLLLIILAIDCLDEDIKNAIVYACETIEPLYALHITTEEGDIPNTNKLYKLFAHKNSIVPGNSAVERVSQNTIQLFLQANSKFEADDSASEYLTGSIRRNHRSI